MNFEIGEVRFFNHTRFLNYKVRNLHLHTNTLICLSCPIHLICLGPSLIKYSDISPLRLSRDMVQRITNYIYQNEKKLKPPNPTFEIWIRDKADYKKASLRQREKR